MPGIKVKLTYQVLYAFSQILFPLITFPYLAKVIGPEGLGKVASIEYISGFIIAFAALGIPFLGIREVAKNQEDHRKRQQVFSQLYSIHLVSSAVGIALFLVLNQFKDEVPPFPLIMLGCANILLTVLVADWYFQGIEAFRFIALRNLVVRFLGLVAILIFVRNSEHFILYYSIVIASQLIISLTTINQVGSRIFKPKPAIAFQLYKKSLLPFFLTTSFISLYVFLDVIILGLVANDEQVGFYSTALKIVKLTLFLILSLSAVLFPRVSALIASGHNQEGLILINKSLQFTIIATIPLCTMLFILAPEIITVLLGEGFASSLPLLRILSILPLIIGLSNVFVFQVLLPFNREKELLKAVLITTVYCMAINGVLANLYAAKGTSLATVATELCAAVLMGFFARRTIMFRFPFLQLVQSLFALLPLGGTVFLCRYFLSGDIFTLVCSSSIGILFYGLIQLLVFKSQMAQYFLQYLKSALVK